MVGLILGTIFRFFAYRFWVFTEELDADLEAIERQVRTFEMPGTGILDFEVHAKAIARAGIYDAMARLADHMRNRPDS